MTRRIAILVLLLSLSSVTGAPAPVTRRQRLPRPSIPAECIMHWRSSPWRTSFRTDGGYEARSGGAHFIGIWWVNSGVLFIREASVESPGVVTEYKIWLTQDYAAGSIGSPDNGINFRLEGIR